MREENIIVANKDTTERMTTRERQHIEVAKLGSGVERAESGRVREGAFDAFVLLTLFFFFRRRFRLVLCAFGSRR